MFSTNGDWMENEVSSDLNPGDANIEFMRIPVISSIVNADGIANDFTGTDEEKEAKLIAIIRYIDENSLSAADAAVHLNNEVQAFCLALSIEYTNFFQNFSRPYFHGKPGFAASSSGRITGRDHECC